MNALTDDIFKVLRYGYERGLYVDDCDCGADELMLHSPLCSVTPIYAQMVKEELDSVTQIALSLLEAVVFGVSE